MKLKQLFLAVTITLIGISCTKQDVFTPQTNVIKSDALSTVSVSSTTSESNFKAYIFIEPKNKQNLIANYLKDSVSHAPIPFLGFNFGFGISSTNKNDLLNYINLKYWYNGQLPAVRTVNISQTTFKMDSVAITNSNINDFSTWVTILVPVNSMSNDTKRINSLLIGGTGLKTSVVNMNTTISSYYFDYTGNYLPKTRYRVYTTFVSPAMRFDLTRSGFIFLKGNN